MHDTSMKLMATLMRQYWANPIGQRVYDVGSRNINGTYATLCELWNMEYIGLDIEEGRGVDVVVKPYNYDVPPAPYVISGQTLEHIPNPFRWIIEVMSICEKDGCIIIIAPWTWDFHPQPLDCWRVLPDGMRELLASAGLTVLEVGMYENDCYGVAKK